jgi:hypothetical protein
VWLACQQPSALFGREPVAQTDAKTPHALHAADACGQLGTQEAGVGGLVCHAAHGRETEIDGGRCVLPLLEVNPITEDDGAVERQPRLRAVPRDELANRVIVGALAASRSQAAKHRRLRMLQVGQGEYTFRHLLALAGSGV